CLDCTAGGGRTASGENTGIWSESHLATFGPAGGTCTHLCTACLGQCELYYRAGVRHYRRDSNQSVTKRSSNRTLEDLFYFITNRMSGLKNFALGYLKGISNSVVCFNMLFSWMNVSDE